MTLTHHLQIVGFIMFGIFPLNFAVEALRLGAGRSSVHPADFCQVFIVHSFFIMLSIAGFGVLSVFFLSTLTQPSEPGQAGARVSRGVLGLPLLHAAVRVRLGRQARQSGLRRSSTSPSAACGCISRSFMEWALSRQWSCCRQADRTRTRQPTFTREFTMLLTQPIQAPIAPAQPPIAFGPG